jgi:hypothetical protein
VVLAFAEVYKASCAIGINNLGADGNVIRTTDGGLTWSVPINAADATLYALVFVDKNIASVHEPASSLLVAFALLGLMARRRLLG